MEALQLLLAIIVEAIRLLAVLLVVCIAAIVGELWALKETFRRHRK